MALGQSLIYRFSKPVDCQVSGFYFRVEVRSRLSYRGLGLGLENFKTWARVWSRNFGFGLGSQASNFQSNWCTFSKSTIYSFLSKTSHSFFILIFLLASFFCFPFLRKEKVGSLKNGKSRIKEIFGKRWENLEKVGEIE